MQPKKKITDERSANRFTKTFATISEQYFHTRYDEQYQDSFRQIHIDIPRKMEYSLIHVKIFAD